MRYPLNGLLEIVSSEAGEVEALRELDLLADEISLELARYGIEARINSIRFIDGNRKHFLEIYEIKENK